MLHTPLHSSPDPPLLPLQIFPLAPAPRLRPRALGRPRQTAGGQSSSFTWPSPAQEVSCRACNFFGPWLWFCSPCAEASACTAPPFPRSITLRQSLCLLPHLQHPPLDPVFPGALAAAAAAEAAAGDALRLATPLYQPQGRAPIPAPGIMGGEVLQRVLGRGGLQLVGKPEGYKRFFSQHVVPLRERPRLRWAAR